jgi:hypothetical protein
LRISFAGYWFGRIASHHRTIRHIADYHRTSADDRMVTNHNALPDYGARADQHMRANGHRTGQHCANRNVGVFAKCAIMVDAGFGVDDAARANLGIGADMRTGCHKHASAQNGGRRDMILRVKNGDKIRFKPLDQFGTAKRTVTVDKSEPQRHPMAVSRQARQRCIVTEVRAKQRRLAAARSDVTQDTPTTGTRCLGHNLGMAARTNNDDRFAGVRHSVRRSVSHGNVLP